MRLWPRGGPCCGPILKLFGERVQRKDGSIDRAKVAAVVFADKGKLEALNKIVHPAVKKEILSRITQSREQGYSYFFLEVALLFEDHYDAICDDLWYIYADESVRRQRLMSSRGYSKGKNRRYFFQSDGGRFFSFALQLCSGEQWRFGIYLPPDRRKDT